MVHDKPIVSAISRERLHKWFFRLPGRAFLNAEKKLLAGVLPHLFGQNILQVGRLGNADLLARSRIPHRVVVELEGDRNIPSHRSCLWAEPHALPIASNSIDVVLLPHVLEFTPHMQATIQEMDRILVAEGHLLIFGFNALSLVGAWCLLFGQDHVSSYIPCQGGQFPSLHRIKGWVSELGFQVISVHRYFFRPPTENQIIMERLRFLDTVGPRFWPFLSGAYFLVAKKRVTTLTLIRPYRQQSRGSLIPVGLGEPSSRHSSDS